MGKREWTGDDCLAEAIGHFQAAVRTGEDTRVGIGRDGKGRAWYYRSESGMNFAIEREDGKGSDEVAEAITPRDIADQIESIAAWMAKLRNEGGE